ncbi:MAG: hypothetical protein QG668_653 [Patescibacteria group bacterium]|nr:hypothetical protein [Patescibacteria group bacterium]
MAPERPSGVRFTQERFHKEAILGTVRYYLRDDERLATLHQGVPEELVYAFEAMGTLPKYQQEWVREQVSEEVEDSWARFQEALGVLALPSQEMILAYERVFTQIRDMVGESWYAVAFASALRREAAWNAEHGVIEQQEREMYQQTGWSKLMRRALKGFGSSTLSAEAVEDREIRALLKHGPPRPPKLPRELMGKGKTEAKASSVPTPAPVPAQPASSVEEGRPAAKKEGKGIQRRRLLTAEEGAMDAHSWRWAPKRAVRPVPTPHPHGGYEGDGDDE